MSIQLSPRERAVLGVIKREPGLTAREIFNRLPEYTYSQLMAALNPALYRTKGLVRPESSYGLYRWYVNTDKLTDEKEETEFRHDRIELKVEVNLDPVPGVFSTPESVVETIQAILQNSIPHYHPKVTTTQG